MQITAKQDIFLRVPCAKVVGATSSEAGANGQ